MQLEMHVTQKRLSVQSSPKRYVERAVDAAIRCCGGWISLAARSRWGRAISRPSANCGNYMEVSKCGASGVRFAQQLSDATSSFPYLEAGACAMTEHTAGGRDRSLVIGTLDILVRQDSEHAIDEIAVVGLHPADPFRKL